MNKVHFTEVSSVCQEGLQYLPGGPGEPASFLKEYRQKLRGLYSRFYTPAAAEMAKERQEIAEGFYQAILREICAAD